MEGIKRSPAEALVFSFITCGIYYLYWVYTVSSEMKLLLEKQEINPGVDLLLTIFCPPYSIYWSYQIGEYLHQAGKKKNMEFNNDSIMYLVLALFGMMIVNVPLIQSRFNEILQTK
jgi:hypothetical protein